MFFVLCSLFCFSNHLLPSASVLVQSRDTSYGPGDLILSSAPSFTHASSLAFHTWKTSSCSWSRPKGYSDSESTWPCNSNSGFYSPSWPRQHLRTTRSMPRRQVLFLLRWAPEWDQMLPVRRRPGALPPFLRGLRSASRSRSRFGSTDSSSFPGCPPFGLRARWLRAFGRNFRSQEAYGWR